MAIMRGWGRLRIHASSSCLVELIFAFLMYAASRVLHAKADRFLV
jgi:hypothetical protein